MRPYRIPGHVDLTEYKENVDLEVYGVGTRNMRFGWGTGTRKM
jgi:hypothetical protein